jgi:hypothetical protein
MRVREAVLGAATIGLVLAASMADASQARPDGPADPAFKGLREAATACFAERIQGNRRATELARTGRWYEAAGVIASLCRPEVGAMVRRHDELRGYGSGGRYFTGAYVKALEKALSVRVGPVLEASAAPADEGH